MHIPTIGVQRVSRAQRIVDGDTLVSCPRMARDANRLRSIIPLGWWVDRFVLKLLEGGRTQEQIATAARPQLRRIADALPPDSPMLPLVRDLAETVDQSKVSKAKHGDSMPIELYQALSLVVDIPWPVYTPTTPDEADVIEAARKKAAALAGADVELRALKAGVADIEPDDQPPPVKPTNGARKKKGKSRPRG